MIVSDRREGSLPALGDTRAGYAPLWRNLDRNVPLRVKLAFPVVAVTILAIVIGAFIVVEQTRRATEAGYITDARAVANSAAVDFVQTAGRQQDISTDLTQIIAGEPNVIDIWIVDTSQPGGPVVASSRAMDIGATGLLESPEIAHIQSAKTFTTNETRKGQPVLETILRVADGPYAVVVLTSLAAESETVRQTVIWLVVAGTLAGLLDVAGLGLILDWGVLRRIRRVQLALASFGRGQLYAHLSEGDEPPGHDVLFNLARETDKKLGELAERQRAGDILNDLGIASLQGAAPQDLAARALDLVRRTGDLDRCFIVDTSGTEVGLNSSEKDNGRTAQAKLPIWLGALVRAAAKARRPVLADNLGEECRYWDVQSGVSDATAAFVPLAGTPDPIGVMVGVARPGTRLNTAVVTLMESVGTTLGESLQRNAADKARHESEVKSRALSTVSHEMRNPLNAMLGFSSLLLSGAAGTLNEKQEAYMHRVDDASKHLLSLVNDYLDLARIMAGSLPVQIESVAVEPEVKSVLELLGPGADDRNVSLHSLIAPDVVAHVDRLRLRQILVNLLSNAIKFTPARGHVRIEVAGGSNGVRISVIDTGIGIPADRQHLIFTEFAQLHKGDASSGSGLGLVLTKRFVEAMGGFIRFTSSEGAGTIFDVWLPGENSPRTTEAPIAQAGATHALAI